MAKYLDFKYQAESPEKLLQKKLDAAPLAHAQALLKAYLLLDAAEKHGLLDLLRGAGPPLCGGNRRFRRQRSSQLFEFRANTCQRIDRHFCKRRGRRGQVFLSFLQNRGDAV